MVGRRPQACRRAGTHNTAGPDGLQSALSGASRGGGGARQAGPARPLIACALSPAGCEAAALVGTLLGRWQCSPNSFGPLAPRRAWPPCQAPPPCRAPRPSLQAAGSVPRCALLDFGPEHAAGWRAGGCACAHGHTCLARVPAAPEVHHVCLCTGTHAADAHLGAARRRTPNHPNPNLPTNASAHRRESPRAGHAVSSRRPPSRGRGCQQ